MRSVIKHKLIPLFEGITSGLLDTSLVSGMWVPAYVEPIPPKTGNPSNKSTAKMYSLWNMNMEFALKKVCTHIFWTQIQRFECLVRVSASLSYHLLQSAETIHKSILYLPVT